MKPHIDGTEFGSITVDGESYEHDIVIRLSGNVKKRKKKLSKERYGTSHTVSVDQKRRHSEGAFWFRRVRGVQPGRHGPGLGK